MEISKVDQRILEVLKREFTLDWKGIHGIKHWGRVREIGLRLAAVNGADPKVVELFALFHDVKRQNNGKDPQHGLRSALLVEELNSDLFALDELQLKLLFEACKEHSNGLLEAPITVQTCWDADRLDLGRVGIIPDKKRLCTANARNPDFINWAFEFSTSIENHIL